MSLERTLQHLFTVLADERSALRAMDAARVELAANEKERLFGELLASGALHRKELRDAVARLVDELRRNAILLAHARDCTRDALVAAGALPAPCEATPHRGRTLRPARLSVQG
jgi:hypothetical protein